MSFDVWKVKNNTIVFIMQTKQNEIQHISLQEIDKFPRKIATLEKEGWGMGWGDFISLTGAYKDQTLIYMMAMNS